MYGKVGRDLTDGVARVIRDKLALILFKFAFVRKIYLILVGIRIINKVDTYNLCEKL